MGVRVNVVSPVWVKETLEAMGRDSSTGMPAAQVARSYVACVTGTQRGKVIDVRILAETGVAPYCPVTPSGELLRAVDEFNRGDWYACHETLEELWVGSDGEIRDLYQGLLQFAVALHHWREGNFNGSVHLLTKGADHLRRVRPICQRVEAETMVAAAYRLREALTALGPERMAELDPDLIPRIVLTPQDIFDSCSLERDDSLIPRAIYPSPHVFSVLGITVSGISRENGCIPWFGALKRAPALPDIA